MDIEIDSFNKIVVNSDCKIRKMFTLHHFDQDQSISTIL